MNLSNLSLFAIDYSITSPAVLFKDKDGSFKSWAFWKPKHYDLAKKLSSDLISFNLLDLHPDSWEPTTDVRRFNMLADCVTWRIAKELGSSIGPNMTFIAIEGYSFGSKHTFAHKIGEATGMLLAKIDEQLRDQHVRILRPAPSETKKAAGAKVKEGKVGVLKEFERAFNIEWSEFLTEKRKNLPAPIHDICDSWAAMRWLENQMKDGKVTIDTFKNKGVH